MRLCIANLQSSNGKKCIESENKLHFILKILPRKDKRNEVTRWKSLKLQDFSMENAHV